MEGLNEFSGLVGNDLFHTFPEWEQHARASDGNLVVEAPMPSGHGTIVIQVLQMPNVRVEILGCPETMQEFEDPDLTFQYIERLRTGVRAPLEQFQDYESGGVAVLTYRYAADVPPAQGFGFQFTTSAGSIPEEVANELAEHELLPHSLLVDYFFHGTRCFGFIVHEDVHTDVTEDQRTAIRHFLRTDTRVADVDVEEMAPDDGLIDADIGFLTSDDPDTHAAALSALVGHARLHARRPHFATILEHVLPHYESENAALREAAVKVAAGLTSAGPDSFRETTIALMERAAKDPASNVRHNVARNLGPILYPIGGSALNESEQAAFLEKVHALTTDTDQEVLEVTIGNLGVFDTPPATDLLLGLTKNDATRMHAILALQRRLLRPDRVIPALLAIAADEGVPALDRAHALDTLGCYTGEMATVEPGLEATLLGYLNHDEPMLQFGSLRAILMFAPSDLPEARILELTTSETEDVRAQSFMTIAARRIDSPASRKAVWAGTQAINSTVRQCAEHAWNDLFQGTPDPEEAEADSNDEENA